MKRYIYSTLILGAITLQSCSSDQEKSAVNTDAPVSVTVHKSATASNGSFLQPAENWLQKILSIFPPE
jgi:PBP1b-binding outer membrane lipoprotein LpoB